MTEVRSPEQPATVGTPSPPTTAPPPSRSWRSVMAETELDTRLLGMVIALVAIWIAFNIRSGGDFLTARNLWNLSVQSTSIADHGDGHGPDHRVAQHRPLGRVAAGLPRVHDGARPDRRDDRVLRSRRDVRGLAGQLVLVDRRPCGRRRPRRARRRPDRVHRRLRRGPVVHRHPRRLPRLAGRDLPHRGQAGADARPAQRDVPAHRRWSEGIARGVAELVARHPGLCRDRAQHLPVAAPSTALPTSPCGRCGWTWGSAWSAAWSWWPASHWSPTATTRPSPGSRWASPTRW